MGWIWLAGGVCRPLIQKMRRSLPGRWEKGVPGTEGGRCRGREMAGRKGFHRQVGVEVPGFGLPRQCCHLPRLGTTVNGSGGGPSFSSSRPVSPSSSDGPREGGHVLIAHMCLPCARTVAGTGESGVRVVGWWWKQTKDTAYKRMWDRCEQNR